MGDNMDANPSIPVQRKQPVSTPERPDEGESILGAGPRKALQGYLSLIITVAFFGASTFSSLISQLAEPTKFSLGTTRTFLATSWLLFVLTFGSAMASTMLFGPYVALSKVMERPGRYSKGWTRAGIFCLFLTHFSALGGFLFISLVAISYAE